MPSGGSFGRLPAPPGSGASFRGMRLSGAAVSDAAPLFEVRLSRELRMPTPSTAVLGPALPSCARPMTGGGAPTALEELEAMLRGNLMPWSGATALPNPVRGSRPA